MARTDIGLSVYILVVDGRAVETFTANGFLNALAYTDGKDGELYTLVNVGKGRDARATTPSTKV